MLGKTHMAVGVAAGLVVMHPQNIQELIVGTGTLAVGSVISDIDIGTSDSHKEADKIIALRKKAGWSQEELGEKLGVTRQSVSKWEGAQSVPDMDKIVREDDTRELHATVEDAVGKFDERLGKFDDRELPTSRERPAPDRRHARRNRDRRETRAPREGVVADLSRFDSLYRARYRHRSLIRRKTPRDANAPLRSFPLQILRNVRHVTSRFPSPCRIICAFLRF